MFTTSTVQALKKPPPKRFTREQGHDRKNRKSRIRTHVSPSKLYKRTSLLDVRASWSVEKDKNQTAPSPIRPHTQSATGLKPPKRHLPIKLLHQYQLPKKEAPASSMNLCVEAHTSRDRDSAVETQREKLTHTRTSSTMRSSAMTREPVRPTWHRHGTARVATGAFALKNTITHMRDEPA